MVYPSNQPTPGCSTWNTSGPEHPGLQLFQNNTNPELLDVTQSIRTNLPNAEALQTKVEKLQKDLEESQKNNEALAAALKAADVEQSGLRIQCLTSPIKEKQKAENYKVFYEKRLKEEQESRQNLEEQLRRMNDNRRCNNLTECYRACLQKLLETSGIPMETIESLLNNPQQLVIETDNILRNISEQNQEVGKLRSALKTIYEDKYGNPESQPEVAVLFETNLRSYGSEPVARAAAEASVEGQQVLPAMSEGEDVKVFSENAFRQPQPIAGPSSATRQPDTAVGNSNATRHPNFTVGNVNATRQPQPAAGLSNEYVGNLVVNSLPGLKHGILFSPEQNGSPSMWTCTCGYFVFSKPNMKLHIDKGNNEWRFICEICEDKHYTLTDLKNHMLTRHRIAEPYKEFKTGCTACGEKFADTSALRQHRKRSQ